VLAFEMLERRGDRLGFARFTANALVPLNQQGLRPDVIPTIEVEYAFSAPW